MATDFDRVETMLEGLEDDPSRLTKWEQGFVEDMRDQVDGGFPLTSGQFDKLKDIYDERVR